MACGFLSTTPRPGDQLITLLRKLAQAAGAEVGCYENEWTLWAKILTAFGGQPMPGDSIALLVEKLRRELGGVCRCGNWQWASTQQILDLLSPGAFRPGDFLYILVWKILEAVNAGIITPPAPPPTPPVPPPPVGTCCLALESSGVLLLESSGCLELESC